MKISQEQYAIVLTPENDWERSVLKELNNRYIKKIRFTDEWNQTGGLRLESATENESWGR